MNEIQGKKLAAVLEKKGFRLKEGGNHELYYFFYNDKRTNVRVTISRGGKSYSGDLLKHVYQGMFLNKAQFWRFIECSMSEDEYVEHLKVKEHISENE